MITIDHLDPSKEYHIVDVGINFDSDGKICGDVSKLVNSDKVITTPVPGGVGLLTTAFLMSNVLKLCLRDK
jgi:methylenetetrahydrofolate dehydrogenase (NADP+)/methenyltetrahydrofolate cyclohydrolase